jgi:hypothetical protein
MYIYMCQPQNVFIHPKPVAEGTWFCSWLRHSATSSKVVGSISNGVTGIFH